MSTTPKQALAAAIEKWNRAIEGPNGLDAAVSEAAVLVATGQRPQADLDQAIKERDAAIKNRDAALAALTALAAQDAQVMAARIEAERLAAAKLAKSLLAERETLADEIQTATETLVAAVLRHVAVSHEATGALFEAGLRDDNRKSQLDTRAVAGFIADQLTRSGACLALAPHIAVPGTQHFGPGVSLREIETKRNLNLLARLGRAQ